mgnify:CR=1 FL=1
MKAKKRRGLEAVLALSIPSLISTVRICVENPIFRHVVLLQFWFVVAYMLANKGKFVIHGHQHTESALFSDPWYSESLFSGINLCFLRLSL